jgi:LEA14-like dessication related protein
MTNQQPCRSAELPGRRRNRAPTAATHRGRHRSWCAVALLAVAQLVGGCAGLSRQPLPPKVEITGVRLSSVQPSDLRLRVGLRVDNPNAFALDIASIDALIAINGVRFAEATLANPVTLAPAAATGVELDIRTRLDLIASVLEHAGGAAPVPYEVSGNATLQDGLRLPFARRGELPVAQWLQGARR